MTDTPQHIYDLQLKLWLEKSPGERLYLTIRDIEEMRISLRDVKKRLRLPLDELDPVGQFLQKRSNER